MLRKIIDLFVHRKFLLKHQILQNRKSLLYHCAAIAASVIMLSQMACVREQLGVLCAISGGRHSVATRVVARAQVRATQKRQLRQQEANSDSMCHTLLTRMVIAWWRHFWLAQPTAPNCSAPLVHVFKHDTRPIPCALLLPWYMLTELLLNTDSSRRMRALHWCQQTCVACCVCNDPRRQCVERQQFSHMHHQRNRVAI